MREPLRQFEKRISKRYTETTLQRMLTFDGLEIRRAAILGLSLIGTMESNEALAQVLLDEDDVIALDASEAIWKLWFRGGSPSQNDELQRLLNCLDFQDTVAGLDALIRQNSSFAEVYNQRAIIAFRRGDFTKAIADCRRVLELNPYHYGAHAGMGQSYLKLNLLHAALRAFQQALEVNPRLDDLADTIEALQHAIEENGTAEE